MLHARVEALREHAGRQLAGVLRETGGTRQGRLERESAAARYAGQVARYDAAENGLCFGRLDLRDGERHYIGRIGLPAESADDDPLLLDWRAPAARAFYVATPAAPTGCAGAATWQPEAGGSSGWTTRCSTGTVCRTAS